MGHQLDRKSLREPDRVERQRRRLRGRDGCEQQGGDPAAGRPQSDEGWLRVREGTAYRSGVMVEAITLFPSAVTTPTTVMASPLFRNS